MTFATIVLPGTENEQTTGGTRVEKGVGGFIVVTETVISQENERALLPQQHLHYLLLVGRYERRNHHRRLTSLLDSYGELIDSTATWMADFVTYDAVRDRYIIKGVIPAQETLKASVTYNPPFELSYWHYALQTAQQWRQRRGLERNALWDTIIQKLSPLAAGTAPDGTKVYLAAESAPDTYTTQSLISDHPAVLGAMGVLPASELADTTVMRQTLTWIWSGWNWDNTW
jgi:hypothetical protein